MTVLIAKLIIAIPELGKLFLAIQDAYKKEIKSRRYNRNKQSIDDWVRDNQGE